MERTFGKMLGILVMVAMLCLTGLVMAGEAQAQRFTDNGDGTVTDTQTGLMWTKDANPFGRLNWHDAMSRCRSFSISGIGGWRLPSGEELVTLSHAIKGGHPFTGVQSSPYWSSSTYADYTDHAWNVFMHHGIEDATNKSSTNHVWPVRAGQ